MKNAEAKKVVKWFQANVGLVGWEITVTIGKPPSELGGDIYPSDMNEWYGRSQSSDMWHTCVVWVNPEAHTGPDRRTSDQVETLLHELLHGFFMECGTNGEDNRQEWCMNQLATILVKQYRADMERQADTK